MPLKDKEKRNEASKARMQKMRKGVTGQGVTKYPAIIYAMADPVKRDKLEKIYESLKTFKQESNVYYGYPGLGGVPFDMVGEYLEATVK